MWGSVWGRLREPGTGRWGTRRTNSADQLSATARDDLASADEPPARAVPQVLGNQIRALRGLRLQTSDGK